NSIAPALETVASKLDFQGPGADSTTEPMLLKVDLPVCNLKQRIRISNFAGNLDQLPGLIARKDGNSRAWVIGKSDDFRPPVTSGLRIIRQNLFFFLTIPPRFSSSPFPK